MKKLVALVMMALLVPAAAYAKNGCKDDKAKFCKDVKAKGGKVGDCLREHANEISAACKEQMNKPRDGKKNKGDGSAGGAKSEKAPEKPAESAAPADAGKTSEPPATETPPPAPAAPGGAEESK